MATITTSTQTTVFNYPSNSYMVRSPVSDTLWTIVRASGGALELYRSTNNGSSWSLYDSFTRANLQEWSGIFIDGNGYMHIAYRVYESSRDKIYYRQYEEGGWSNELLVSSVPVGAAGAVYQGVSIVASAGSRYTNVHIAVGTTSGSQIGVTMFGVVAKIVYDWWFGVYWSYYTSSLVQGTTQWLMTGSGRISPALDIRHNGNGYSSSVPDLWLAFGRTQVNVVKIPYSSGRWTGPINATTLATNTTALDYTSGRYDGTRFLVAILNGDKVDVYERDSSNTVTTLRTSPVHTTGVVRHVAVNYNSSSGNFRLYAVGTSTAVLYYVDYVRETNSWGSWVSTGITLSSIASFGSRRGSYGNARYDYYTQSGSSPFTLAGAHQVLVFPPDTPVIEEPVNGAAADVASPLDVAWTFSDTDDSDTQGHFALSRQIGVGSLSYWRTSDNTWQASEVQNASATQALSLPAGWGADSDDTHTYRVKVWDSTGLASVYSSGVNVIPSARINPVITFPATTETATLNDTFTRVAADLVGSTPDTGFGNWAGSAGKWSINGTQAVWAAGPTDNQYLSIGTAGDARVTLEGVTIDTTAGGSTKNFYVLTKGDTSFVNDINAVVSIDTSGNNTVTIYKKIGGVTTLLTQAVNQLPSQASYTFDISLKIEHAVITLTAGPVNLTATISEAEVTGLSGNLFNGFASNFAATINRFYVNKVVPQVVTASDITVTWTVASQRAFRVELYEADTDILLKDSGLVTSVGTSYRIPYTLLDNTRYKINLTTTNTEGLVSNTQTITFTVDFVEPMLPTLTLTSMDLHGLIRLGVLNPDPTGLEPTARSNTVYRRRVGDTTDGQNIGSLEPSVSANLLALNNYSFETDIGTDWRSDNVTKSTVARTSAEAQLGTYSLEQTAANGTGFGGVYRFPVTTLAVEAGTSYTLSFWFKATAGRVVNGRFSWRLANQADNGNSSTVSVTATGAWQQITVTATAPANTAYAVPIMAWSNTANSVSEKCWVDNVRVEVTGNTMTPSLFDDFTAASDVNYEYRCLTTGDNGTSIFTDWQD